MYIIIKLVYIFNLDFEQSLVDFSCTMILF